MKKVILIGLVVVILAILLIMGSIFFSHSTESVTPDDLTKIFPPDDDGPTGILPLESGVTGTVSIGPICPVMKNPLDPDCADKLYLTSVKVVGFSTVMTDDKGVYTILLPPGEYTIQAVGGNPFPQCMSQDIVIESGVIQEVNLSCDTGIR